MKKAQLEPITVVARKRSVGDFVSDRDCEEYHRTKAITPTALAAEELDALTLKALAASRMDSRHDRLNSLMD